MIERAFIQEEGMGRLGVEETLVRDELERRGVDVVLFTPKLLARRRLALTKATMVVGHIDVVESAMRQLGVTPPVGESYPEALRPFLLRRVIPSTLRALEEHFRSADSRPVFIKPRSQLKRFTGFVCNCELDLSRLHGVSRQTPIWFGEVVRFVSEHRVFVVDGVIRDVRPYAGDEACMPDREFIDRAVRAWTQSGEAARGYGIDFGVLDDGRTALVELNDGYGLGSYGLAPVHYVDLCIARWEEWMAHPV